MDTHWITISWLATFLPWCLGFDTYFPMYNIQMTLPVFNETLTLLKSTPLATFHANNLMTNNDNNEIIAYYYNVENRGNRYFRMKHASGELWMNEMLKSNVPDTNTTHLEITAQKSPNEAPSAIMSVSLNYEQFANTSKDVCREYSNQLCFWNTVTFQIAENDADVNRTNQKLGQLSSKFFRTLCPNADVRYNLVNATDYFMIKNGSLYSKTTFDHDTYNPGPQLSAHVECFLHLSPNVLPIVHEKLFNITVLDLNDNGIIVQAANKTVTIELEQPHFVKSASVDKNPIIFLDNDSLMANSKIKYHIYGDFLDIIRPVCSAYESDHRGLRSSVFNCRLTFARDGILRKSPYCIILQAIDTNLTYEIEHSKAHICLTADLSMIHESDQLPTPLPLTQNRQPRRKNKKLRNDDEMRGNRVPHMKESDVKYPNRTFILYNTVTVLSRIAQPIDFVNNTKWNFSLKTNPMNAFGITEQEGIVYVADSNKLQNLDEHILHIDIGWSKTNATIEVKLLRYQSNQTCSNEKFEDPEENNSSIPDHNLCSTHTTEHNCTSFCGDGSATGFCYWRQSTTSAAVLTSNYSTCSPNLRTCPDKRCDALEHLAHSYQRYICPQDCVGKGMLQGPAFLQNNGNGPGIKVTSGVCSCGNNGKCICQLPEVLEKLQKHHEEYEEREKLESEVIASDVPVTTLVDKKYFQFDSKVWFIVVPFVFIIVLAIVGTSYCMSKNQKRTHSEDLQKRGSNDTEIINMININIDNHIKFDFTTKWEFSRTDLKLDALLGEGEFGRVVKGFATGINGKPDEQTVVAVKMLKTGANSVEFEALWKEFQSLQEVSHPNVVKLLGACTKDETPLLILEYCQFGSLWNYLRTSRNLDSVAIEYENGVEPMTVKDILSFAWQICKGMTYLAENRLVHRDLAARNVLLAEGKVCKISDFGLTRDIYEEDTYTKRSKDRIPVKWMAPECLGDNIYKTSSDVWAFGVLAWELVTLGASPYPGIQPQDLYAKLKQGYRMPRPSHCSEEIYSIVESCWAENPGARPSFKSLTCRWETLLGKTAKYLEFDENCTANPEYNENNNLSQHPQLTEKEELFRLESLWYHPSFDTANAVDNKKYLEDITELRCTSNATTTTMGTTVPEGYDVPRSLIETQTVEQKLRYQNDLPLAKRTANFYMNQNTTSATNLLAAMIHYDSPVKRYKSYVDMTSLKQQQRTSCDYNDHDDEGGCREGQCKGGKIIKNNLNVIIGDKTTVGKDITFRFSSANNLQERLMNAM